MMISSQLVMLTTVWVEQCYFLRHILYHLYPGFSLKMGGSRGIIGASPQQYQGIPKTDVLV